ncbi:MAG: NTPase, partial [Deltaproteobacteria bacterium]
MTTTNSNHTENKNNPIPENLLYDTPLLDPDEDRLGRKEFARFLAQAILKMNADEGFVFALNGPWGSGKTTVINFVLHFIEKADKSEIPLVVVRFNPWWFSGREQLLHQFFTQFRAALGEADVSDDLQKVGNKLDLFANILAPLTFIPTVGTSAEVVRQVVKSVSASTKAAAETLNKDVHKLRVTIDSLLRKQHSRILVVIDDIDRLPAEEIRQLFQVVKAVADFPKTIYLLAFDRRVVSDALDTLQSSSGESYVEKIVQCPFDLPSSDRVSLRRLLFEQIDEIMKGTPEELIDTVEFGNLYWDGIDSFIKTPRDVKRYINILRPTYPILIGDVHSVDFLGIQALRLFAPEMYHFVATNKEEIAGTEEPYPHTRDELESAATVRRLSMADCRRLFPLIRRASTETAREVVRH